MVKFMLSYITFIVFLGFTAFFASASNAKRLLKESVYQDLHCDYMQGQKEHVLPDKTRVDCLTKRHAIEYDFSDKWAECVGQALHYGSATSLKPVCVLIVENGRDKYTSFVSNLIDAHNLNLTLWVIYSDTDGENAASISIRLQKP